MADRNFSNEADILDRVYTIEYRASLKTSVTFRVGSIITRYGSENGLFV